MPVTWGLQGVVRGSARSQGLIHHSDRGAQYLALKYTERLAQAGIDTSVGSVGDSYDKYPGRERHRAVQGRGDQSAWAMEVHGPS